MTARDGSAASRPAASPKDLPAIDTLLRTPDAQALVAAHGHTLVASEARSLMAALRVEAIASRLDASAVEAAALTATLAAQVDRRLAPSLRTVFNLTGTVIHTNLGRSPLPEAAVRQLADLMAAPINLEYDLAAGARGERDSLVEGLLCELTGAEAATVVNNNAAAVLLVAAAMVDGDRREIIVSRGELVEIGGAFRLPDVMASANATLVEVGTTNRTHPGDYECAINDRTALLMKIHTSNYAVQGFTAAVDETALASIARARGVPLATDLGSGALVDFSAWGLPREPLPQDMIRAGCDIVTFSGDKLLGGPQAGLIVGRREAVERIRRFPMKRALRPGKLALAALEATLRIYLRPERLAADLPVLRLLTRPAEAIRASAVALRGPVADAVAPRFTVEVVDLLGQIGSGSLPIDRLPSAGLAIEAIDGHGLDALATAFRGLPLPVIGRIASDRLLLDLRCLEEAQVPAFVAQLSALAPR